MGRSGVGLIHSVFIITFALIGAAVADEAEQNWAVYPGGQLVMATGDVLGNAYIIGQGGAVLTKHDRLGNTLWTHRLADDQLNVATCVAGAAGAECYVGGRTMGTTISVGDNPQPVTCNHAFVARYASDGTLLWAQLIGSTGNDIANRIVADAHDNCYVVGDTSGSIDGSASPAVGTDPFVAKLSAAGELIWISQLREASTHTGLGVGAGADGQVTIAGEPGFVAVYDVDGLLLQCHRFAHRIPAMQDVAVDSLGNACFCGWDSPYNAIVTKFDREGVFVWEQRFRLNGWSCPKSIAVVPDGSNDIVTGGCEGSPTAGRNCEAFSRRFDPDGNLVSMCTVDDVCGQAVGVDGLGNWYVIGDAVVVQAGAPVYTTAPLTFEAESAALTGGVVETTQVDASQGECVSLAPGVEGRIEWAANVSRAGMKTLVWRYRNGAAQAVPAVLEINGFAAAPEVTFAPTAEADGWMSLPAEAYLNVGSNTVVLGIPALAEPGLLLDRLEIIDADDNVAQYRAVTYSNQTEEVPAPAALDGRLASCWSMSQYPQWLEIDLGQPYPIDRVKLTGRSTGPCRFDIETKLRAGDTYQQVVDCRDSAEALTADAPVVSTFARTPARYVRLNIVDGADGEAVDVQEFGVFTSTEQAAIIVGSQDYRTIQEALAAAEAGATVTLQPGLYAGPGNGEVHWDAKSLTLTSVDANDPDVVATTVIEGTAAAPVVTCTDLASDSRILGLAIKGGLAGVLCQNASPGIERCRIVDNQGPGIEMHVKSDPTVRNTIICANEGAGILMVSKLGARTPVYNAPDVVNCTLADNAAEGAAGGKFTMRNCIVWGNGADARIAQLAPVEATVRYSCVQGGCVGEGNIESDPLFLAPGDYHLAADSPCIDGGDPSDAIGAEPVPCGGRINMGAYGGTIDATRSLGN